jgi:hypothetical protein
MTAHPEVETGRRWPRLGVLLIGLGREAKASVSGDDEINLAGLLPVADHPRTGLMCGHRAV